MTDAEKYVRQKWPRAIPALFGKWIIIPFPPIMVRPKRILGKGLTAIAAWADAANRLEARGNAAKDSKYSQE